MRTRRDGRADFGMPFHRERLDVFRGLSALNADWQRTFAAAAPYRTGRIRNRPASPRHRRSWLRASHAGV
jgi:hypothetical protein